MPTMYNSDEIEAGGATVREMKVRSALQYGLNLGPDPAHRRVRSSVGLQRPALRFRRCPGGVSGQPRHPWRTNPARKRRRLRWGWLAFFKSIWRAGDRLDRKLYLRRFETPQYGSDRFRICPAWSEICVCERRKSYRSSVGYENENDIEFCGYADEGGIPRFVAGYFHWTFLFHRCPLLKIGGAFFVIARQFWWVIYNLLHLLLPIDKHFRVFEWLHLC